jgi:hypothetical protein
MSSNILKNFKACWRRLAIPVSAMLALLALAAILGYSLGLVGRGRDSAELVLILGPERGLPAIAVLNGEDSLVLCPGQQEASARLAEILHAARPAGHSVDTLYASCLPTAIKAVSVLCEKVPFGSLAWYGENSQTERRLAQALQQSAASGLEARRLAVLTDDEETTSWGESRPRWDCRLQRHGGGVWNWRLQVKAKGCVEIAWDAETGRLVGEVLPWQGEGQSFVLERHSRMLVERLRL